MVDILALKGKMVQKEHTQASLAKALNISEKTLNTRFKTGIFKTNEVDLITKALGLSTKEAVCIFFDQKVS